MMKFFESLVANTSSTPRDDFDGSSDFRSLGGYSGTVGLAGLLAILASFMLISVSTRIKKNYQRFVVAKLLNIKANQILSYLTNLS